jgi:glycosyltransferase involved in cell wall biosynthesis
MAGYDGVKIVLTMYDISFRSYARRRRAGLHRRYGVDPAFGLSLIDWMRLLRYELRAARRADQIHVMSGADARYLARFLPTRGKTIRVVPNAVDLDHYTVPPPGSRSARQLLFIGNFGHMPNIDALDYLMQKIWPRVHERVPDAELVIAGANPGPSVMQYEGFEGVTIAGAVRETAPYYQACTMLVAPIRAGSGTRLKILEALACGTPVVTTTIGAEGIEGIEGEHFLIADDAAKFADATCRLLENPELRERLGENGRTLVERHYGWDASAAAALAAYAELIDSKSPDAAEVPAADRPAMELRP